MLLVIDIGNTHTKIGLWWEGAWLAHWRVVSDATHPSDSYGHDLRGRLAAYGGKVVVKAVVASVIPQLQAIWEEVCLSYLGVKPLLVSAATVPQYPVLTDNPAGVGADRIANVAGAYAYYRGPSIVIDMGTATTFDVVSAEGALLGGVIAPGLELITAALARQAAQLREVPLEAPARAIGKNTTEAVQSGLIFGYVGLVEGMVVRLKREWGAEGIKVLGTGGLVGKIGPHTAVFDDILPLLTVDGLRVIAEL
ncbi:MAG TPA: type III pantothenate kinase [Anaerolineae bacterium]|nr:type III pantothenate kinase [Anaerolineae bacterium]